jgi:hypothetical protein
MTFPIYAVVGIPVIFCLGLLGALAPPAIAFFFPSYGVTQKYYFTFFNGLAAGLILAVGYTHPSRASSLCDGPLLALSLSSSLSPALVSSVVEATRRWSPCAELGSLREQLRARDLLF